MSIQLCVFDAYGTLFDVDGAARELARTEPRLAGIWPRLASDWRRKQLEYSWLRQITGDYVDFWQITRDGLDWAMAAQGLQDRALADQLMELYRELPAYPEVPAMLEALHHRGIGRAILSNGAPQMLDAAVHAAGIAPMLDAMLSADTVRHFKPAPEVYAMIADKLGVAPKDTCFVTAIGSDVVGAARAGFRVLWVNRSGQPAERLPYPANATLHDLSQVPDWV